VVPIHDHRSVSAITKGLIPWRLTTSLLVGNAEDTWQSSCRLNQEEQASVRQKFQAEFLTHTVPCSGLIRIATEERLTVWELAPSSYTARRLSQVCLELWTTLNFNRMRTLFGAQPSQTAQPSHGVQGGG